MHANGLVGGLIEFFEPYALAGPARTVVAHLLMCAGVCSPCSALFATPSHPIKRCLNHRWDAPRQHESPANAGLSLPISRIDGGGGNVDSRRYGASDLTKPLVTMVVHTHRYGARLLNVGRDSASCPRNAPWRPRNSNRSDLRVADPKVSCDTRLPSSLRSSSWGSRMTRTGVMP